MDAFDALATLFDEREEPRRYKSNRRSCDPSRKLLLTSGHL